MKTNPLEEAISGIFEISAIGMLIGEMVTAVGSVGWIIYSCF